MDVKNVKLKTTNLQVDSMNKLRLELILNGLLANQEDKEWSRLELMEYLFSKDVTQLSRAALTSTVILMELIVIIAKTDGIKFITIKEIKRQGRRRSNVALAQTPTCLEMDVKHAQQKTVA